MKVYKKGYRFEAFCTVDGEFGTQYKIGHSMGYLNIKTLRFVGGTGCMVALYDYAEKYDNKKKLRMYINKL